MNNLIQSLKRLPTFIAESIEETKKLTFPTRESIIAGTLAVFIVSIILSIYIFSLDFILSQIIAYIIKTFGG
ncbi:MAG: preprotein translocase subunit SecE [candidate division WOR-3 bacterium]|jgi:preprotein translocase SecE subunit